MAKKRDRSIKRRSGNAFCAYLELINWVPEFVIMGGVGLNHEEVDVMKEEWKGFELYGFEANPKIFEQIKRDFPGILSNYGLWNESVEKELHYKGNWKDGSSLFPSNQDQNERTTVHINCITLDQYFNRFENFDLTKGVLWLDCEGAELQALQGAKNCLKKVEVINIEMTCVGRGDDWSKPKDVDALLKEYGFKQAYIHTIRPCIGQYDAIYLKEDLYSKNEHLVHCF